MPGREMAPTPNPLLNPGWVAANARGQVPPEQRAWLDRWVRQLGVMMAVFAMPALLCTGAAWIAATAAPQQSGGRDAGSLFGSAVVSTIVLAVVLGVITLSPMRSLWRMRSSRRDLDAGRLEQTTGRVVWEGKAYVLDAPSRLFLPPGMQLPPGRYRIFFAPSSGLVLSAEFLGRDASNAESELVMVLGQALGVDAETLGANRQEQLTPGQTKQLLKAAVPDFLAMAAMGAMILVAILVLRSPSIDPAQSSSCLGFAVLWILLFAWIGLYRGLRFVRIAADVVTGRMAVDEGTVTKSMAFDKQRPYRYVIHRRQLVVTSREAYDALIPDLPYRVYYAPHSKIVLAVEPLATLPNTIAGPRYA